MFHFYLYIAKQTLLKSLNPKKHSHVSFINTLVYFIFFFKFNIKCTKNIQTKQPCIFLEYEWDMLVYIANTLLSSHASFVTFVVDAFSLIKRGENLAGKSGETADHWAFQTHRYTNTQQTEHWHPQTNLLPGAVLPDKSIYLTCPRTLYALDLLWKGPIRPKVHQRFLLT